MTESEPNGYFCLATDKILVKGAKNSVLLDLKNGKIFRLNPSAVLILNLANKLLTVKEIAKMLEPLVDSPEVVEFMKTLIDEQLAILTIEKEPHIQENTLTPRLNMLWIELTSKCNLHCIHCYADTERDNKQIEGLEKKDIIRVVDEAVALGCQEIQFTGGEATLRPDLKELITYTSEKGVFVEVFTNGTLLDESIVKFFKETGIHVAMSIYSHKAQTHDSITGIKGSYERTLNSLKLLLAYEVPIRCAIIAMKENEAELEETCYFLSQLGVLTHSPDPIRPTGRGKTLDHWPEKYGEHFIQAKPSFIFDREIFERNRWWNSCWFGKAAITGHGDVLPCVFARGQIAGNVKTNTLSEIMDKMLLSMWSLSKDQIDVCKDCEYRYVCEDCRPLALGSTNNIHAKTSRCIYDPYEGRWENDNLEQARSQYRSENRKL